MWKHGWKLAILIIIGAVIFLWLIKAPIMSTYLTNRMGVPVTVRTISMWPTWTSIRYFKIKNPEGYHPRTALEVKKIEMDYKFKQLTGRPSVIDLITLNNVTLNIEVRNRSGSDNNWAAIGAEAPDVESSRGVIVKKLVMNDITVNVTGRGAKVLGVTGTKHFDRFEFHNIDSNEGFPTKELVAKIFQGVGFRKFIESFLNPAQRIKKSLNPFDIFGKNSSSESSACASSQMLEEKPPR